ncbi:MAG: prepilin peptidase [Planctomycetes bacterium]|nr:prepilin peptidase [Planctomycetota bacterium]
MTDNLLWILVLWCGLVGGIFGSFMNVVVYRWPRGMSIVKPGSHCPSCGNDIRWFHNVPVLGWLMLRGRCFDCGVRISPRYPLVEALVMAIFAVLAGVEVIGEGGNFPAKSLVIPLTGIWGIYAYHLLLLCSLVCVALIERDEQLVPLRLIAGALLVGLLAPIWWPWLHPLGGEFEGAWLRQAFLGAVAALIMRTAAWPSVFETVDVLRRRQETTEQQQPRKKRKRRKQQQTPPKVGRKTHLANIYFPLVAVGVFLGWQAAVAVGCGAIVIQAVYLVARRIARRLPAVPLSAWQVLATFGFLLTWNRWIEWLPALGRWG